MSRVKNRKCEGSSLGIMLHMHERESRCESCDRLGRQTELCKREQEVLPR